MRKTKRVSWKNIGKKFLQSLLTLPREKICAAIKNKTGIRPTWNAVFKELNKRQIPYPRMRLVLKLSSEEKDVFKKVYGNNSFEEVQKSIQKGCPNATPSQINHIARSLGILGQRTHLKGSASTLGAELVEKNAETPELTLAQLAQKTAMLREQSMAAKRFEMLFGDIKKIPEINIPRSDGSSPIGIRVKDENNPKLAIINSPLIGTLGPKKSSMDIFRNDLRLAQADGSDAVLITGNLIYCLVERYGRQRPYRTQVVGLELDSELLESDYPKTVLDKIGPLTQRLKDGKVIFMTMKVYLDQVFKMVRQKFLDADDKPLFKGEVLILLGEIEEAVAMYYSTEAVRAEVFQEKAFANQKIREVREFLKGDRGNEKLLAEIVDWEVYRDLLALMGHVVTEQIDDRRKLMTNYLAYRIESDIPNAKVVGIGDTYLKVGKQLVAVVGDKAVDSVRGGLAGRLREKLYNFVKANPTDRAPAVIFGAGLNPWGVGLYASFRIREQKPSLNDLRMTDVIQLPVCIDSKLYRETVQRMVKAKERLAKLASTQNFQSGTMRISFHEPAPIPVIEWHTSDFLTNQEIFATNEDVAKYVAGVHSRAKRVYMYKEGCTHYGASFVAHYDSPNDPNGRYIKLHNQVLFEAFIRDNIPIHFYMNDGDIQHWLNYPVYKEVNKQLLDPEDFLAELTRIENDSEMTASERIKAIKTLALNNTVVAGVLQPEEQVEAYGKAMAPYAEFFRRVIERAKAAGIKLTGKPGDLGYIGIGQGNHNENSFKHGDVRFSEAKMTRKEIISILLKIGYNPPDLEKLIVACETGGIGMAEGTFTVELPGQDAYEYCVFMKHKHGTSKTKDNMQTMIRNFATRGTTGHYSVGRFTINLGGDDHMGGHAVTRNAFHVKTGGQMFDGPFGLKLDFPKQNLFSTILGVPAGGPSWGSLSIVRLDFRITRKLAAYKITLPEKLFPNPA